MPAPHRRRLGAIAVMIAIAFATLSTISAPVAGAAGTAPTIKLVTGAAKVTLKRPAGRHAYLDIGAYIASIGGPFEIWAARPDYDTPVSVSRIVRDGTAITMDPLPSWVENDWFGLSRFIHVTVTDAEGTVVLDRYHALCPGTGELARVNDDGPDVPTFPQFCGGSPFTLGAVWGIDSGWASNVFGYGTNDSIKGPDGHYTATVSIAPDYQALFGVTPADATVSVDVTVKTTNGGSCLPFCAGLPARDGGDLGFAGPPSASVPIMTNPDPSIRPDLVALPAWGISIDHQRRSHRDFLDFGATVWNRGPSPMVVEGFRRPGEPIMDGWEYFYAHGVPVGRAPAGDLEYDARPGHQHWHFEQFARYALLGADQMQVVRSEKTGFCLAPTDAIDMTGARSGPARCCPPAGETPISKDCPGNRSTSPTCRTAPTSSRSRRTPTASSSRPAPATTPSYDRSSCAARRDIGEWSFRRGTASTPKEATRAEEVGARSPEAGPVNPRSTCATCAAR